MRSFKILIAALGVLTIAPVDAGAQQLEKVKMAIAANAMNYAPYFAAIKKGYFAEDGFDVEVVEAGGGVATPAQISGQIHFNTSASTALSAMLRGAALKIVYYPWDKTIYQIWAFSPEIKTLQDVKGKSIGIQTRGDTFELGARISLAKHGIDPNSVGYTALGFGTARRAAIAAGSLPVVTLTPEDVEWLKSTNQLKNSHMLFDMYPSVAMPLAGIAVRTEDLEKDRNRVKRFIRAVHKGWLYSVAHRDGAVDIVTQYAKGSTRETIDATYEDTMKTRTDDGTISPEVQKLESELRAELINVAKDKVPPIEKMYDFSMAKEAFAELKAQGWKPVK
jgi:ABC-type nitrate/sulfonate/bicarbonate transport system substrate-binding protein